MIKRHGNDGYRFLYLKVLITQLYCRIVKERDFSIEVILQDAARLWMA